MAKGPAPKLYSVKKAEGNPGKRKLNAGPAYKAKRPRCPGLGGEARKCFHQLARPLFQQSLLTEATLPAFVILCQLYGMMHDARAVLEAGGFTVTTERGVRTRPEVGIFHTSAQQFRMCCQ